MKGIERLVLTGISRQRSELIHGRQKSRLVVRARAGSLRGDQHVLKNYSSRWPALHAIHPFP